MTGPLRLNGQSVKHPRLANREIADVDHFLNFAFAFGDDFPGLERDELAELMFQLAQRVSQTPNSVATDGPRSFSPFLERFLRARDRFFVIFVRRSANAGKFFSVDRRDLVDLCATPGPFAVEYSCVVLAQREFLEH